MRYLIILFALVSSINLQAQETVPSTGGDASGAGGSSSYTIGQVVYTTNSGTNGSVSHGVQQPYEISIVTGVDESTINLEMVVFPNPTTNYIQLKIENEVIENLKFQLIDLDGKIIETKVLVSKQTTINMNTLPKAIYFLNVLRNNQTIKSFKVIKQ